MPDPLSAFVTTDPLCSSKSPNSGDFQPGFGHQCFPALWESPLPLRQANDPGHGPHFQLTQKIDGKTVTQHYPLQQPSVRQRVRSLSFRKFRTLTGELVDVNRKICRLRPVEQTSKRPRKKNDAGKSYKKSLAK